MNVRYNMASQWLEVGQSRFISKQLEAVNNIGRAENVSRDSWLSMNLAYHIHNSKWGQPRMKKF